MRCFILILCWSALAAAACTHTRDEALTCVREYGDANGDGQLDRAEIDALRASSLRWWERGLSWIAGETTSTVLRHCDANGDGVIEPWEAQATQDTCIPTCEAADLVVQLICERQAAMRAL